MTTPEALKALYVALGGDADDVATANTSVDVLNAIAVKFEGDGDATLNPDAIMNVVAVLDNMISDPTLIDKNITANGTYNASSDNVQGYSKVVVNVAEQNNAKFGAITTTQGFQFPENLLNIEIPNGFTKFRYDSALSFASALKTILLPSSFTTIPSSAFADCTALEKITINKAEGSISGAPWGAPATCEIVWLG